MSDKVSPLEELGPVQRYLKRIGASFTSLFRAGINIKVSGYDKEVASIRFMRDGTVHASDDHAPTEEEAEAIANAVGSIDLPEAIKLAGVAPSELPNELRDAHAKDVFDFRNREGLIVMFQQRVDLSNGDKRYVPWTYWSDGVWRRSEPDGRLPLYGMEGAAGASRIFVHEGAKAARAAQEAASNSAHPWYDFLSSGAHVGFIGGIHHVRRADWDEIRRCSPDDLIIVPDNDAGGMRTVPDISRQVRCRTSVVIWDNDWPARFDLADDMPQKYIINGKWIGPSMQDLLHPAEWATDQIPPVGRGAPLTVAREPWLERWYRIEKTKTFCPKENPIRMLDKENFNAYMRPFSQVKDSSEIFIRYATLPIEQPTFAPNRKERLIRVGGAVHINQYVDQRTKPVAGDTAIFHEFLRYIFPDELDQKQVLRWMRTIFAKPETRIGYAILAISENQGVGKSTIGTILSRMIGEGFASFPGDAVIQSDYNGWIVNKRLVVVNEIYAGQSWKTYNRLKSMVTDPFIDANIKHQATYQTPNWAHFWACSNSGEALRIEDKDRRWYIPRVTEELWPQSKFDELYDWMDHGGLSALAYEFYDSDDYERAGSRAPSTAAKQALIESSRPPEHEYVVALMERLGGDRVMDLSDSWIFLKEKTRSPYLTTQRVSHMMKVAGYGVTAQRRVAGRRRRLVCASEAMATELESMDVDALGQMLRSPEQVWDDDEAM